MKYIRESKSKNEEKVISLIFKTFKEYFKESGSLVKKIFDVDLYDTKIQQESIYGFQILITYNKNGKIHQTPISIIDGFGVDKKANIFDILDEHIRGEKTYISHDIFDASDLTISYFIGYNIQKYGGRYKELSSSMGVLSTEEKLERSILYGSNIKQLSENIKELNDSSKYMKLNDVGDIDENGNYNFGVMFSMVSRNPINVNIGNYLKKINT
jgi:hypothetical protein